MALEQIIPCTKAKEFKTYPICIIFIHIQDAIIVIIWIIVIQNPISIQVIWSSIIVPESQQKKN